MRSLWLENLSKIYNKLDQVNSANLLLMFLLSDNIKKKEFLVEKKKNGEGKGGKYLEGEYILLAGEMKMEEIFREGKYFFCRGGQERKSERWRIFREGKLMVTSQHNQLGDYIAMRLFEC